MLLKNSRANPIHTRLRRGDSNRGFTLLELMIVILIIGLILTIFLNTDMFGRVDETKVKTTKVSIHKIENALNLYKLDNGSYPTTEQGLKALVKKPELDPVPKNWRTTGYLKSLTQIKDPWGRPFEYRSPGEHGKFDVFSKGSDENSDKDDITSWDKGEDKAP